MAHAKSTDIEWDRIWKEKFEDPGYYSRAPEIKVRTSSQVLAEYSEGVQSSVRTVRIEPGIGEGSGSVRGHRHRTKNIRKSE